MCIPHVKIILFTHHRMLRYAALRRELNTVIGRIYERGERVIVDYARENVHSLKDISTVRRMNENMIEIQVIIFIISESFCLCDNSGLLGKLL